MPMSHNNIEQGALVSHKRRKGSIGIVLSAKQILGGYDVQVLWPEARIVNHHSNCLEFI